MNHKNNKDWLILVGVFFWPFVYLFPYVLPIQNKILRIGNDFSYLYFVYKAYLLSYIDSMHFPLWSPSESSGYPFYSNPFAQVFYPLNIPLAIYHHIIGGYSELDHQRFTVLGISIFALGMFLWLRSLHIKTRPALFSTLLMSTSFKVIEIIRFPNAVHAACWYPWILFAMTKIAVSTSRKQLLLYDFLLFFSSFCLITSGYPYYLYYSLFLIPPYAILLTVPVLYKQLNILDNNASSRRTLINFIIVGFLVISSTGFYLIQQFELMSQTTDRSGNSFEYATAHLFNAVDTIGSLIYPPASQIEGWYHFSFIGFFLLVLFLFGVKDQYQPNLNSKTNLLIMLVSWFMFISYLTYGKESLLFRFLWRVLPGFSSLRVWGRMNIILIPILGWLLALAYQSFEDLLFTSNRQPLEAKKIILRNAQILTAAYSITLGIQLFFVFFHLKDDYWTTYFLQDIQNLISYDLHNQGWQIPSRFEIDRFYIGTFILLSFLSFLLLLFFCKRAYQTRYLSPNYVFMGLFIVSTVNMFIAAPWTWTSGWNDVGNLSRIEFNTYENNAESFKSPRSAVDVGNTISLTTTYNTGVIPNWYFERYSTFLKLAELEPEAINRLLGIVDGQKIYFSSSIEPTTIQAFLDDATRFAQVSQVTEYNGNILMLKVDAPESGYISFIDNWDPYWRASLDGQPTDVFQLFGTFKSVSVPAGIHKIVFAYCPPLFELLNSQCSKIPK